MPLPPDLENRTRTAPATPVVLPPSPRLGKNRPEGYLPDAGLVNAVRVALILRRPLLLTGQPGTGKTDLATYVNWKLGHVHDPLVFEAKSTSTARDLFYTYNTLERFHSVFQRIDQKPSTDYIVFNALGEAILQTNPRVDVADVLPSDFLHSGPRQSVVLIDEIDKAPRDFPNDILNEVERNYFKIPELGNRVVRAQAELAPVLILTSNSEKNLPAAFLRRCVYYHIPFPEPDRLREIVATRVTEIPRDSPIVNDVVDLLTLVRSDTSGLQKPPATAELLDWLLVLVAKDVVPSQSLRSQRSLVETALSTLVKHEDDQARIHDVVQAWLASAPTR